ncbi:MAG: APC family permease [Puniceicoccales bacterium]|jgi:APA family basic amino acid/polyamine antiporter|nr:APC family permease [Puniceicoccales bacterium]
MPAEMAHRLDNRTSKKQLGILMLISLVISSQVGSGIFVFPAILAPYGTIGLVGWIFSGAGAISLALIFSELSSKIVKNGGPHVYVTEAFGQKTGFFIAWIYWIISWASNSVLLVTITNYLSTIVGTLSPAQTIFIQIGVLLVITFINLMGIRTSGFIELILTSLKVIPLFILPFIFFTSFNLKHFKVSGPVLSITDTWTIISKTALLGFWGFVGVECATTPAERVKNPQKTLPRAIIFGTACVAFIYLFNLVSVFGVTGFEPMVGANAPYAIAMNKIFPGYANGNIIISLLAVIVCFGTLNAWTLSAGQIAQGAAADRLFPSFLGKTNKNEAPALSILIASFGIIILLIIAQFSSQGGLERLIDFMASLFLIIYLACSVSYAKMVKNWKKDPADRIKSYMLAAFAIAFCIFVVAQDILNTILALAVFISIGIPVYLSVKKRLVLAETQDPIG